MITNIAKAIEISAESDISLEAAIHHCIIKASKFVQNIKGAWVKEKKVIVENDRIPGYLVNLKVAFVLD